MKTVTYDPGQWQLVPRQATGTMIMDLRDRAPDFAKVIREDGGKRLIFSCDFALVYRLFLAAAPTFDADTETEPSERRS